MTVSSAVTGAGVVPGRVARTSVSGIGPDGALRYHIGIAFIAPIALPDPPEAGLDTPPLRLGTPATPTAPAPPQPEPLRNRW